MSDIYLDINHSNELLQAVRQAFEHNLLILGFNQTVHNSSYIAPDHLFESSEVAPWLRPLNWPFQSYPNESGTWGSKGQHANYVDLVRYQEIMQTF